MIAKSKIKSTSPKPLKNQNQKRQGRSSSGPRQRLRQLYGEAESAGTAGIAGTAAYRQKKPKSMSGEAS